MHDDQQPPDQYFSAAAFHALNSRVSTLEGLMAENADATNRNTEAIDRVEKNTRDIVDTFQALAGGFKVLQGLGKLAKPLAAIAGFVAATIAAYTAWKGLGK